MADQNDPPEGEPPSPGAPGDGARPPESAPAEPGPDESARQPEAPDYPLSEPAELREIRARLLTVIQSGATRARHAGGAVWTRLRAIRRPRSVRDYAVWTGWSIGGVFAALAALFVFLTWGMPSTDDLWEASNAPSITFIDINGTVILREGAQNGPPVELDTLPPYVGQAFIAIEDQNFYNHFGIDVSGLARATLENVRSGRVVQGGSTITQQLAKNLFLDNSRTFRRKFQEVALAVWLESRFTKEQLLALYLSRVYFGAGAWGIEAASERYFDRPARELTLLQSALLAGLVKAPSRLNPAQQETFARSRAELVLNTMVDQGFISSAERDAALREDLQISRRSPAGNLGYFRDWIDPLLNDVIGQANDDFIVETTLDIQAQRAGEAAVNAAIDREGEARRFSQAAIVALDENGGVRAMVGGRAYGKEEGQSEFNRVTQARRQPGSSFKFFIYLAAMEAGLTPWTVRVDAPIVIDDWAPGNYNNQFYGPLELARAFALSLNMVAISIAREAGHERVIEVARRLGVTSPLHNYRSLALGAQELTLMELTQAYAAMAANGNRVEAHGVVRVRRSNGEVVWSWRPRNRTKVIEDRTRRYMNYMMNRSVESGTSTAARIQGRQLGGKTGTTNDYRDAWFIGFTPGLAAGVWVGNDDHRIAMARMTGGQAPAQIWREFMLVALRGLPVRPLDMPTAEDYATGPSAPDLGIRGPPVIVGAPIGAVAAQNPPPDPNVDRSLDFGPEG